MRVVSQVLRWHYTDTKKTACRRRCRKRFPARDAGIPPLELRTFAFLALHHDSFFGKLFPFPGGSGLRPLCLTLSILNSRVHTPSLPSENALSAYFIAQMDGKLNPSPGAGIAFTQSYVRKLSRQVSGQNLVSDRPRGVRKKPALGTLACRNDSGGYPGSNPYYLMM